MLDYVIPAKLSNCIPSVLSAQLLSDLITLLAIDGPCALSPEWKSTDLEDHELSSSYNHAFRDRKPGELPIKWRLGDRALFHGRINRNEEAHEDVLAPETIPVRYKDPPPPSFPVATRAAGKAYTELLFLSSVPVAEGLAVDPGLSMREQLGIESSVSPVSSLEHAGMEDSASMVEKLSIKSSPSTVPSVEESGTEMASMVEQLGMERKRSSITLTRCKSRTYRGRWNLLTTEKRIQIEIPKIELMHAKDKRDCLES
jgi:hypothetical protein